MTDEIQKLREQFRNSFLSYAACAEKRTAYNTYTGFIRTNNTLSVIGKWACHAPISDYNWSRWVGSDATPKYFLSFVTSALTKGAEKLLPGYIDWLINRSPWQTIFVDKDVNSVLQYGHLVDCSQPSSFIGSAMIASRFFNEAYDTSIQPRYKVYERLLGVGATENEAFFYSHMFTHDPRQGVYFAPFSSGHSTFYAQNYQESYVRNFLRATPVYLRESETLKKGKGYSSGSLNRVWGDTTTSNAFLNWAKGVAPKRGNVKEDLNIFRKIKGKSFYFTSDEDLYSLLEQLRERVQ